MDNLEPDDPRVNFELHVLVQQAMERAHLEVTKPFNPFTHEQDSQEYRSRMREARKRVIDDHSAKKMQQPPFRRGEGT